MGELEGGYRLGEQEGKLKENFGICRFCGQVIMVKAEEDATEQELNTLATDKCECEGAREWQEMQDQKAFEEAKIKECCANETVREVLIGQVENIQRNSFRSIQITTEDGVVFAIRRTTTGKLKIKAKEITVVEAEA